VKLKLAPETVRAVVGPAMRALASSWRIRTVHEDRWKALNATGRPYVYLLWHEAILPLLWHHRGQGVAVVVSEARDGQYLADFALALGYRAVRGSSTRGATRALLGAVRELREGRQVAFTPDGPRGPRRTLKPGALVAAQRAGTAVITVHAEAAWAWRLNSWDRMMIPKPGARVRITYGRPFDIAPGDGGLAAAMTAAEAELEELAGSVPGPRSDGPAG
jgi:lysophospholipid acyltransferase (LPLAT)-like uncharacterized protein